MSIPLGNIRRIEHLARRRERVACLIRDLNRINGGEEMLSISHDVMEFVDQRLAAKGLLSLVIETSIAIDEDLKALGVEIP
jgi:hypothetical protein